MDKSSPQVVVMGLDDPEHDVRLLVQQINELIDPLKEENDPNMLMWALQEVATGHALELHGTLTALKILTNSLNNVIDIGPFIEAELKGVH
jgi:hypothetical protein